MFSLPLSVLDSQYCQPCGNNIDKVKIAVYSPCQCEEMQSHGEQRDHKQNVVHNQQAKGPNNQCSMDWLAISFCLCRIQLENSTQLT